MVQTEGMRCIISTSRLATVIIERTYLLRRGRKYTVFKNKRELLRDGFPDKIGGSELTMINGMIQLLPLTVSVELAAQSYMMDIPYLSRYATWRKREQSFRRRPTITIQRWVQVWFLELQNKVLTVKRSVIYIEAVLVSVTFSDFIEVVGTGTHVKTPVDRNCIIRIRISRQWDPHFDITIILIVWNAFTDHIECARASGLPQFNIT